MDQANAVIIGGGVIGCAIARALSARWDDIFVLEAMPRVGMGASTRNSGVIHAGLYYAPGSLKARHCLRGNQLTYEFCAAHGVPHRNTGKLVVSVNHSQERDLAALMDNAEKNGVEGLHIIDRAAIRAREPHIEAVQAIDVPSSGIVSSEELVKAYARIAAGQGTHIVTNTKVERIEIGKQSVRLSSTAGEIEARCVVNSAGLFADEVAAMMGTSLARHRIYPVRGEYCEVVRAKSDLIKGLVYPVPPSSGLSLGEHLTKTLWGTVLVGPTARYIEDKNDYERDREPAEDFARNAQAMLPELQASDLVQAYSGIRAKLVPPDKHGVADFIITRDPDIPNVIQLIGMDSPGLTSAPAIAEQVLGMATEILG
jgi:glycerol-3-phosphate dehydrogenase